MSHSTALHEEQWRSDEFEESTQRLDSGSEQGTRSQHAMPALGTELVAKPVMSCGAGTMQAQHEGITWQPLGLPAGHEREAM